MSAADVGVLTTAIGGVVLGTVGAVTSFLNRRDTRQQQERADERDAKAQQLALQTASRSDLEAIIAAQRQYIADSDERYDRVNKQLQETAVELAGAKTIIYNDGLRILHLDSRVTACDEAKEELTRRVEQLEQTGGST